VGLLNFAAGRMPKKYLFIYLFILFLKNRVRRTTLYKVSVTLRLDGPKTNRDLTRIIKIQRYVGKSQTGGYSETGDLCRHHIKY
jgi:hypothetical protein